MYACPITCKHVVNVPKHWVCYVQLASTLQSSNLWFQGLQHGEAWDKTREVGECCEFISSLLSLTVGLLHNRLVLPLSLESPRFFLLASIAKLRQLQFPRAFLALFKRAEPPAYRPVHTSRTPHSHNVTLLLRFFQQWLLLLALKHTQYGWLAPWWFCLLPVCLSVHTHSPLQMSNYIICYCHGQYRLIERFHEIKTGTRRGIRLIHTLSNVAE